MIGIVHQRAFWGSREGVGLASVHVDWTCGVQVCNVRDLRWMGSWQDGQQRVGRVHNGACGFEFCVRVGLGC